MDGQKVSMVMGLCLPRIVATVTGASYGAFNGEPSASCFEAAGTLRQGHDLRLEMEPKVISLY